jgi:hypothetical protein
MVQNRKYKTELHMYLTQEYFCPGSKNSIIGKTQRKLEDMIELSTNYVTFTKFH